MGGGWRAERRRGFAVAVLSIFLGACQGVDLGTYWSFERMVVQPNYRAYQGSDLFPDGRVMRSPPEGTVPRGVAIGWPKPWGAAPGRHSDPQTIGARDAPEGAIFPFPPTLELLELGRKGFEITCAPCHGVAGDGASAVAANMTRRRPPSLHEPRIRELSAEALYRVVAEGYGLMPSYAGLLSPEEIRGVVAYVRALQLSQRAVVSELPEPVRSDVLQLLSGGGG